jgi:site-specific DNA recombinase
MRGLVVASFPYGYQPDPAAPGRLVVYDPEASVVWMIYGWLIDERRSIRSIVDELRRVGIPPARGQWGPTQVRRKIVNEAYVGRVYYERERVLRDGRRELRPKDEWIPVPIPSIITPERQAAALAQLARNRADLVGAPGAAR